MAKPIRRGGSRIDGARVGQNSRSVTGSGYIVPSAIAGRRPIRKPLKRGQSQFTNVPAGGKSAGTKVVSASGVLRGAQTKTVTASGALAIAQTKTVTASGRVVARRTVVANASGALRKAATKSATASGALSRQFTKTSTASGYIVRIPSVAVTASGVLVKSEYDYEVTPTGALRGTLVSPAGATLGTAPLLTITRLTRTQTLDQIGSISFSVPATDTQAANVTVGVHIKIYHQAWGYLGEFIVSQRRLSADQATYECSAWSLLIELGRVNTFLRRKYSDVAISSVISTSNLGSGLYGLLYGTGWTQGTFDAGMGNVVVEFNGQSVLESIIEVVKRKKMHIREGTSARTLDVGAFGADSGYRLIAPQLLTGDLANNANAGIIENVSQDEDGDSVVNCVIALGGGQGLAQLTLEKCTKSSPYVVQTTTNPDGSTCWYLTDAASVATYGAVWKVLPMTIINPLSNSDADVANAANALYDAAVAYLQRQKDEHVTYSASAFNVPSGLRAGDQVRVVYRGVVTRRGAAFKWVDVDALFWVITRTDELDASGAIKTNLELANIDRKRMEDSDVIIGALQAVQVLQTQVQPYPSAETFVYREEIAPGHDVTLPIEIDSRVLYLNSCKVRLQTRPLRSTVSAVVGGASSQTTSAWDSTPKTPDAVTSYSDSIGISHTHWTLINKGGSSAWAKVYLYGNKFYWEGSTDYYVETTQATPMHTHNIPGSAHSHYHAHGMDHTHSATLTYGIYDDTAYPTTVRIAIDGVDRTAALGGGSGWASVGGALNVVLDITSYLINASGGLRSAHTITFSCTGGKGQVVATIRSLMTTQAITVA